MGAGTSLKPNLAGRVTSTRKSTSSPANTRPVPIPPRTNLCGTEDCGVVWPRPVLERIAQAMREALMDAKGDTQIPANLLGLIEPVWETGMQYESA